MVSDPSGKRTTEFSVESTLFTKYLCPSPEMAGKVTLTVLCEGFTKTVSMLVDKVVDVVTDCTLYVRTIFFYILLTHKNIF
jgi:hypothetical protein